MYNGHELHILRNEAYVDDENRLRLHLLMECPICEDECSVRGRLPDDFDDYNYRAALAKLVLIGYFNEPCDGTNTNYVYSGV
jgi:hypothetical protein